MKKKLFRYGVSTLVALAVLGALAPLLLYRQPSVKALYLQPTPKPSPTRTLKERIRLVPESDPIYLEIDSIDWRRIITLPSCGIGVGSVLVDIYVCQDSADGAIWISYEREEEPIIFRHDPGVIRGTQLHFQFGEERVDIEVAEGKIIQIFFGGGWLYFRRSSSGDRWIFG
ncbi:hypothetical protein HY407_02120 [Candidatus Gottesmanbacteria bacterium]|nr:hypothetical protein [Candidatus Gottesmanbacteria bacterium]